MLSVRGRQPVGSIVRNRVELIQFVLAQSLRPESGDAEAKPHNHEQSQDSRQESPAEGARAAFGKQVGSEAGSAYRRGCGRQGSEVSKDYREMTCSGAASGRHLRRRNLNSNRRQSLALIKASGQLGARREFFRRGISKHSACNSGANRRILAFDFEPLSLRVPDAWARR